MNYDKWLEWREREIARSGVFIPTASREEYVGREGLLKEAGFMEWERKWFVSRDFTGTGIKQTIADRNELKLAAKLSFGNWNAFQQSISGYYIKNKWLTRDGRKNPFRMLDFTKDRDNLGGTPQPKRERKQVAYKTGKRATTGNSLRKQIDGLNTRIIRATSSGNQGERRMLETERNRLQNQLDGNN